MYKAAIVGLGRMGSTFDDDPLRKFVWTHAGAYTEVKETELVAGSDIDTEKQDYFKKRWSVAKTYSSYEEMIKNEAPDILSICTQPDTHAEIISYAAKNGVKAVICEKPMALSLSEADAALKVCEDNGTRLIINHYKRRESVFAKAHKLISSSTIGDVRTITGYYTNECMNIGTHLFDLICYYGGKVESLSAIQRDSGNPSDPGAGVLFKFKNGTQGHAVECGGKDYVFFELDLIGSNGRIRIKDNGASLDLYKSEPSERYSEHNEFKLVETITSTDSSWMIAAVQDAANCISNNKESDIASGQDGLNALEIIAAIRESSKNNGASVAFPLKNRNEKLL